MQQPRISHRASGRGICSAAVPLCAPAQASMPPRDLQRTLARLAAAAAESPATPATVRGLAADIRACSEQVMKLQGAELIQLRAYYHLGQMALLPCRVVAAATTTLPDVAPEVLHALGNVTGAIVFVDSACSDANGEPQFPSELVTAWAAAARKVTAYFRQLCPRQPGGSRQQASIPAAVQQLMATLLKLWHTIFRCWPGPLDRNPVAASASEAAELAVMLLTCTPEAEAAQLSEASFALLQRHAALTLHLLAETMLRKGSELTANAHTRNPGPLTLALVSDSVQEGLALHLAAGV